MEKEKTDGNNREPMKIVMSKQKYTLWEKKLIYHIVNRVDCKIGLQWNLEQNMEIEIPTKGNIDKADFINIKKSIKSLASKKLEYWNDETKEGEIIHPYPRVSYKRGVITIVIFGEVVPELAELAGGYSNYLVQDALNLNNSKYSQRVFEMLSLKKNFDDGIWNTDVNEMRFLLDCEDKYVGKHKMFFERTILQSIDEINEKTRLFVHVDFDEKTFKIIFTVRDRFPKQALSTLKNIEDSNLTEKQIRCKGHLENLGVVRIDIVEKILFDDKLQGKFWKWWHVNSGSYQNFRNPAGVILKHLSLIKSKK